MHRIEASVLINAPVAECYQQWMQFERFPDYMRRVVHVSRLTKENESHGRPAGLQAINNDIWHCVVRGPFGRTYEINASLVYLEPEKCVSWATTEPNINSDIASTGTVNFLKPALPFAASNEETLIEVTMSYSPGGLLGDLITDVTVYGDNIVYDCLNDFKRHVETEFRDREVARQAALIQEG